MEINRCDGHQVGQSMSFLPREQPQRNKSNVMPMLARHSRSTPISPPAPSPHISGPFHSGEGHWTVRTTALHVRPAAERL